MTSPQRGPTDANDDLKPGRPPRHATQPPGSAPSTHSPDTLADATTGAPNPKPGDKA